MSGAQRPRGSPQLALGLSSGTSVDGVDAALVAIERDENPSGEPRATVRLDAFACTPWPEALRRELLRVAGEPGGEASAPASWPAAVEHLARLDMAVGEHLARAALDLLANAKVPPGDVAFIGSHGQTVGHFSAAREAGGAVTRATAQIGAISVVAERTGITTAGNFRVRDVAAGGSGAPLLPYVDWLLFRDAGEGRALLNLGGIANFTFLPAGGAREAVVASDIGPGNMALDGLAARLSGGRERMDRDGALAARGRVEADLLQKLIARHFVNLVYPRSTGREDFGAAFVEMLLREGSARGLAGEDLLATATAFTAHAVARCFGAWGSGAGERTLATARAFPAIHVSGGGAENPTLMAMLAAAVAPVALRPFDELGIPSRAREAVSFAVLAAECLERLPSNLPQVTGAARTTVLGEIAWGGDGK